MRRRQQLTLFVPPRVAAPIELIRRRLDPVQHGLIAAHVTLCREEDLGATPLDTLCETLRDTDLPQLTLSFGAPVVFAGHGVLLPCVQGEEAFAAMRHAVLAGGAHRAQHAHITLAHPRNPRAPGNQAETLAEIPPAISITFTEIALIEQDGDEPWSVRARFPLRA